ncbi:hypothetical protein OF363_01410 [Mycoplasma enhydrae]|uniref:hypothetical protein n=1 Tax=Mycoplasma enhydrae TaxID=2499220 RepID=UPI0021E93173|nr:hypothetical protein [Mycoplasma enhydrae]MCV3733691.1 hypothetical protein [Mycoplasma enhydrae]
MDSSKKIKIAIALGTIVTSALVTAVVTKIILSNKEKSRQNQKNADTGKITDKEVEDLDKLDANKDEDYKALRKLIEKLIKILDAGSKNVLDPSLSDNDLQNEIKKLEKHIAIGDKVVLIVDKNIVNINNNQAKVDQLKSDKNVLINALDKAKEALKQAKTKQEQKDKQKADLKKEAEALIKEIDKKIEESKSAITKAELEGFIEALEKLVDKANVLVQKLKTLDDKETEALVNQAIERAKEAIKSLKAKLEVAKDEAKEKAELNDFANRFKKQVEELINRTKDLNTISELEEALRDIDLLEKIGLKNSKRAQELSLPMAKGIIDAALVDLNNHKEVLKQKLEDLKKQKEEIKKQIEKLDKSQKDTQDALKSKDKEQIKKAKDALDAEIKKSEELLEKNKDKKDLKDDNNSLSKKIKEAKETLKTAEEDLKNKEQKEKDLKDKLKQADEKLKEALDKANDALKGNDAKDVKDAKDNLKKATEEAKKIEKEAKDQNSDDLTKDLKPKIKDAETKDAELDKKLKKLLEGIQKESIKSIDDEIEKINKALTAAMNAKGKYDTSVSALTTLDKVNKDAKLLSSNLKNDWRNEAAAVKNKLDILDQKIASSELWYAQLNKDNSDLRDRVELKYNTANNDWNKNNSKIDQILNSSDNGSINELKNKLEETKKLAQESFNFSELSDYKRIKDDSDALIKLIDAALAKIKNKLVGNNESTIIKALQDQINILKPLKETLEKATKYNELNSSRLRNAIPGAKTVYETQKANPGYAGNINIKGKLSELKTLIEQSENVADQADAKRQAIEQSIINKMTAATKQEETADKTLDAAGDDKTKQNQAKDEYNEALKTIQEALVEINNTSYNNVAKVQEANDIRRRITDKIKGINDKFEKEKQDVTDFKNLVDAELLKLTNAQNNVQAKKTLGMQAWEESIEAFKKAIDNANTFKTNNETNAILKNSEANEKFEDFKTKLLDFENQYTIFKKEYDDKKAALDLALENFEKEVNLKLAEATEALNQKNSQKMEESLETLKQYRSNSAKSTALQTELNNFKYTSGINKINEIFAKINAKIQELNTVLKQTIDALKQKIIDKIAEIKAQLVGNLGRQSDNKSALETKNQNLDNLLKQWNKFVEDTKKSKETNQEINEILDKENLPTEINGIIDDNNSLIQKIKAKLVNEIRDFKHVPY